MNSQRIDHIIINFLKKISLPLARISLFAVYAWFGTLKIIGVSPATGLVHRLFDATIHMIPFHTFYVLFAGFEVLIGVMLIIPKLTRFVMPLLSIHMVTTFLPLVFLPGETWQGFLIPTLEGQYILKNLVIIALAVSLAAQVHPLKQQGMVRP